MKTQTDPIKTEYNGDVLFIEYRGKRPHRVIARVEETPLYGKPYTSINDYDFEWSKTYDHAYYNDSGGASTTLTLDRNTGSVVAFWAAAEMQIVDAKKQPVTDYAALGYRRLRAPKCDPFEDACGGRCEWCNICNDYLPSEGWICDHVFFSEHGEYVGSGAGNTIDEYDRSDIMLAVRRLGIARALRKSLLRHGRCNVAFRNDFDRCSQAADGVRWLDTLTPKAPDVNATIVGWLDEEIAAHDARRASGEACYQTVCDRYGDVTRFTAKVSWAEALRVAREKRGEGDYRYMRIKIVRRVPKAEK